MLVQAENDDELVKWITALKRCAGGVPGRPLALRTSEMFGQPQERQVRNGPGNEALALFLDDPDNSICAECTASPVR